MYHCIIRKISNFKSTYWFSKSLASQNSVNEFPFGASILNSLVTHFYGIEEIFDIIWEVFNINGEICFEVQRRIINKKENSKFNRDIWYWSKEKDLRPDKILKIFKMQNKHNKRSVIQCVLEDINPKMKRSISFDFPIGSFILQWSEKKNITS